MTQKGLKNDRDRLEAMRAELKSRAQKFAPEIKKELDAAKDFLVAKLGPKVKLSAELIPTLAQKS